MYALEVRRISPGGLKKLERFQIRCLRHIARLPVHISRVSSDDLRERCAVSSVESTLLVRRCLWMKKVVAPVFLGDEGDPLLGLRGDDPTVAVRAAVVGSFAFEGARDDFTPRQCRLFEDLQKVFEGTNDEARARARSIGVDCDSEVLSKPRLEWLAREPRSTFTALLSFRAAPTENADVEKTPCPDCGLLCS